MRETALHSIPSRHCTHALALARPWSAAPLLAACGFQRGLLVTSPRGMICAAAASHAPQGPEPEKNSQKKLCCQLLEDVIALGRCAH